MKLATLQHIVATFNKQLEIDKIENVIVNINQAEPNSPPFLFLSKKGGVNEFSINIETTYKELKEKALEFTEPNWIEASNKLNTLIGSEVYIDKETKIIVKSINMCKDIKLITSTNNRTYNLKSLWVKE